MTQSEADQLLEMIRSLNDNLNAIGRLVVTNQNYLFALHDTVQTLPGYHSITFGNKLKEYQENATERIQKDLKASQDALGAMLKRFSGPIQ